jgi:diguanylate cyclase (GGDEF)-like protein
MNKEKGIILIIDDEKSNIDILKGILQEEYLIFVANSTEQAIEFSSSHKFDLALFGLNDFQQLKTLNDNYFLKEIPIIFISALNDVQQLENSLKIGAADFISKPFSPIIVNSRVNTQLKISHQKKMIEMLAKIDSLTEIPCRASFQTRLTEEWNRAARTATPLTLATLDIDFFRKFNEIYGHPKGDEALKLIASTIVSSLKRAADFVGRIGNDEFALIIPENSAEGAYMLLSDVCKAIKKHNIPHEFSSAKILTASVGGVTCMPHKGLMTKQDFIKESDLLLDRAKKNGRNTIEWADKSVEE